MELYKWTTVTINIRDCNQPSAYDVINNMSETNLVRIINKYGEEGHAKAIARAIVDHRYAYGPIKTTHMLADVVASSFPGWVKLTRLPVCCTF